MVALHSLLYTIDRAALLSRFDLRDYVQTICPGRWRKMGKAIQGLSPLDLADTKPAFTVYTDGYKDFGGSGDSGGAIDFVMQLHGLDYSHALHHIADYLGGGLVVRTMPRLIEQRKAEPVAPSADWQAVAEAEIKRAVDYLWSDKPDAQTVLNYLRTVRGLTDEMIRATQLGYNPIWRKTAQFKEDGSPASLAPGITIPWRGPDGQLVAVRVRCRVGNLAEALGIDPDVNRDGELLPKYLSFVGSRLTGALYGAGTLQDGLTTLITEGEFDALLAAQELRGTVNVVTLGSATNRLSETWRDCLAKSERAILALDADDAGRAGRDDLISKLAGRVPLASVTIPAGKDITDHVVEQGGTVAGLIETAWPVEVPAPPVEPLPSTVPNTWRAALNQYAYPAIAPTFELWCEAIRAGLITRDEAVTVADLVAAAETLGRHTTKWTIRTGLEQGAGGFFRVLHPSYLTEEKENPIGKTQKNLGGRPKATYKLLTPDEMISAILAWAAPRIFEEHFPNADPAVAPIRPAILAALSIDGDAEALAAELNTVYAEQIAAQPEHTVRLDRARLAYKRLAKNLRNPKSLALPVGWTYRNAAEYVDCFTRATIEAAPDQQITKRKLAERIGTSHRTIDALVQRAGVAKTEQFAERQISTLAELDAIPNAYDLRVRGKPKYVVVQGSEYAFSDPAARQHVQRSGQAFTVKYQQANRYSIATKVQPARKERSASVKRDKMSDLLGKTALSESGTQQNATHDRARAILPSSIKPSRYFGSDHDPAWAERWAVKLLHLVTSWTCRDDVLSNRETGELLDYSPRIVIDLLRGCDVSSVGSENLTKPNLFGPSEVAEQLRNAAGRDLIELKAKLIASGQMGLLGAAEVLLADCVHDEDCAALDDPKVAEAVRARVKELKGAKG